MVKKITNNHQNLDNKTILVTGGTGSFGKAFISHVLDTYSPESIRVFSRDELKQWQMKQMFADHPKADRLRFLIGDVRDASRLERAANKADVIIHAAALKQVPVCEADPIEAIKTNILGAVNVIDAALANDVPRVVALSTDKASQPINLYGATKLCSDKLFIQANSYRGRQQSSFAVVRYGNVMGSRGSVIPLFLKQKESGVLTITDEAMTRFWITLPQAVQFVVTSLVMMHGGELFIPKIPSMKVTSLAKAIAPEAELQYVGLRPGEKMHESLISQDEAATTFDIGDRYVLQPSDLWTWKSEFYEKVKKAVAEDFSYTSANNPDFLTVADMKKMLKEHHHTFAL
jgi:UDP-N-acetylglucosamine 4,6-dehydratase